MARCSECGVRDGHKLTCSELPAFLDPKFEEPVDRESDPWVDTRDHYER